MLVDRTAIHELIARYVHAYDSRDLRQLEECFTPDAVVRMKLPDGTCPNQPLELDAASG